MLSFMGTVNVPSKILKKSKTKSSNMMENCCRLIKEWTIRSSAESQAQECVPVVPVTWEAEAGGSLEPGCSRL